MRSQGRERVPRLLWGAMLLCSCLAAAQAQSCVPPEEQAKQNAKAAAAVSVAGLRVPEKAWRHYGKAVAAYRAAQSDTAAREIEVALTIAPAFAQPYMLRGLQDLVAGRVEAVVEDALAARRVDAHVFGVDLLLAGAYNSLHRYREAAEALRQLPGDQAATWQAKYEMTRAAVGLQDAPEALRWSALTWAAAPASCVDAGLLRADALLLARRWNEAVTQLTLYVESPYPQSHHVQALQVLEYAKRRLAQDVAPTTVASEGSGAPER